MGSNSTRLGNGKQIGLLDLFCRVVTGVFLVPFASFAEEGFHSSKDGLPPAVQAAWDSTLLIEPVAGKGAVGSAFIVRIEPAGAMKLDLYVLTADHVVQGNCGTKLGFCKNIEISDGGIDLETSTDIDVTQPTARASGAEVVRSSEYPDLALLKFVVDDGPLWDRQPLPLATPCAYARGDVVYVIGFPDAASRTYKYAKAIEDKGTVKRRWSMGRILGIYHYKKPGKETRFWIGTTADGLVGESGGPGLNAWGEVVGELDSAGKENRNAAYLGNESLGTPHSMLQRCEYLNDFINLRPLRYHPLE